MESLETKIKRYNQLQDVVNKKLEELDIDGGLRMVELLGIFSIEPVNSDTIKIFEDHCCKLDELTVSSMIYKIKAFKSYKIYGTFLNKAIRDEDDINFVKRMIMISDDNARYNEYRDQEFDIQKYIYKYQTELRKELMRDINELACESNPDKVYYDSSQDIKIVTSTLKALLACGTLDDLLEEEVVSFANIKLSTYYPYDKDIVNRIAEYFDLKDFGWEDKK